MSKVHCVLSLSYTCNKMLIQNQNDYLADRLLFIHVVLFDCFIKMLNLDC